ncbi:MAG TPA: hypothetical protein VMK31_04615 [Sphingomicrobium sp.]|nr:hypothetical protein [Sphingomicrobium sp.]
MWRFLAGAMASFLMLTGAFLLWQGRAEQSSLPPPPPAGDETPTIVSKPTPAPEASPRTREQKRFDRADKNKDGLITREELLQPRRKPFAKLDKNGDGKLSFEEWAIRTTERFHGADANRDGKLTRAEYATTAPKPRKKPKCKC